MRNVVRRAATQILLSGCGILAMCASSDVARADRDDDGDRGALRPNGLVVSSSTYDASRGAVASLNVGTPLANTATATPNANLSGLIDPSATPSAPVIGCAVGRQQDQDNRRAKVTCLRSKAAPVQRMHR